MSVAQWRNATGRGTLKCAERSLSQCYFIYYKSHMDRTGTKLLLPRWETGDWLPEPRDATLRCYRLMCLWLCSVETLFRPVVSLTALIFCVLEHRSLSQILYTRRHAAWRKPLIQFQILVNDFLSIHVRICSLTTWYLSSLPPNQLFASILECRHVKLSFAPQAMEKLVPTELP
jgi:hypothetical protein